MGRQSGTGTKKGRLSDELGNDFARDVGEAEVAALEAVGEAGVVEAEEVEQCGVKVVDVNGVFDRFEAKVVSLAKDLSALDTATGHPNAEGVGMMVAPTHR